MSDLTDMPRVPRGGLFWNRGTTVSSIFSVSLLVHEFLSDVLVVDYFTILKRAGESLQHQAFMRKKVMAIL